MFLGRSFTIRYDRGYGYSERRPFGWGQNILDGSICAGGGVPWYVVQSRSLFQDIVVEGLRARGYQAWLPKERTISVERGVVRVIERNMFGTYLFVGGFNLAAADHWQVVAGQRGVARILGGERPAPLLGAVVAALRARVDEDGFLTGEEAEQVLVRFAKGDAVQILAGPFTGHLGSVEFAQFRRVRVLLSFLGRSKGVWIGQEHLAPVAELNETPRGISSCKQGRGYLWNGRRRSAERGVV